MKRISILFFALAIALMAGTASIDAKVKKSQRKTTNVSRNSTLKIVKNTQQLGTELEEYAHGCDYQVTHTVIVANESNKDVPAGSYNLIISPVGRDEYGYSKTNTKIVPGKAIPAHGTVTHTWTDVHFDGTWSYEDRVTLKLKR